jgi:diguanylate cyclase (GGDEF)-like protein
MSVDQLQKKRRASVPKKASRGEPEVSEERRRLGEALLARADWIVQETIAQTKETGERVDDSVQARFEQVCINSTPAVSRWIAGEGIEVTNHSARESSEVFGEIAAQRWASLNEVIRRSFAWRNVMTRALRDCSGELGTPVEVYREAVSIVQVSLEASMLLMGECFEKERKRTDEALAKREEELAFLATHDPLTDLPNRTLILGRLEQMLARAQRHQTPVAALFVDLDNFKAINDTLGHAVGDQLLMAVAARLTGVIRQDDAIGRIGGDEFVVIVEDVALDAGPELVAERLLTALNEPFKLGAKAETTITLTASVGIAVAGQGSAADLLRDADIAMYRAKWDGRNGVAVFESDMQDTMKSRVELEIDLNEALANEEFRLVYQPTLDLGEMRPTGVEALLRWQHPKRGLVQPDEFIPLLEETGLIREVGRWVLKEACRQAAEWRRHGHEIEMAVNISGRQLDDDEIVSDVAKALADSGLPADALTLEVTETKLMRQVEHTAERLEAIKELGVRIAIDDFGTGYSSLAHLKRFPVDALKIDRSFISGLKANKEGRTLIHTLVQLGKVLGIETTAEGIEEADELTMLRAENCDSGQGYLFARPLEAAAAETFFESWSTAALS